jgi:hypothetical protein
MRNIAGRAGPGNDDPIIALNPNRSDEAVLIHDDFERAWRSLMKGYADGCEAKAGIAGWIAFYGAVQWLTYLK